MSSVQFGCGLQLQSLRGDRTGWGQVDRLLSLEVNSSELLLQLFNAKVTCSSEDDELVLVSCELGRERPGVVRR